ncbi:MAG: arsenate reductase/protein-tyrosine-phosphatase family protein [Sporichthyaceae bacterium]
MPVTEHSAPFRLVFVCTGNICRSPFAEILARHLLDLHAFPAHVQSGGLGAVVGAPMHAQTRRGLAPWGLDVEAAEGFRGRQLTREIIADADLILGATTEHRSGIVRLAPRTLPRAFALREFARLAAAVDPAALPTDPIARARALVQAARAKRGARPVAPGEDDIADPMGRSASAHADAGTAVAAAVTELVQALLGRDPLPRPVASTSDGGWREAGRRP